MIVNRFFFTFVIQDYNRTKAPAKARERGALRLGAAHCSDTPRTTAVHHPLSGWAAAPRRLRSLPTALFVHRR